MKPMVDIPPVMKFSFDIEADAIYIYSMCFFFVITARSSLQLLCVPMYSYTLSAINVLN